MIYFRYLLLLLGVISLCACIDPARHNRKAVVVVPSGVADTAVPILPVASRHITVPVAINGVGNHRFFGPVYTNNAAPVVPENTLT